MQSQLAVSLPNPGLMARYTMTAMPTAPTAQKNCRADRPKKMVSLCLRTSFGILISIIIHLVFKFMIQSPNISFTTLSVPFTKPVKISILKISCPMYCQVMVTAGRVSSTAGVLLERKAE